MWLIMLNLSGNVVLPCVQVWLVLGHIALDDAGCFLFCQCRQLIFYIVFYLLLTSDSHIAGRLVNHLVL